jgi:hypothetical protein
MAPEFTSKSNSADFLGRAGFETSTVTKVMATQALRSRSSIRRNDFKPDPAFKAAANKLPRYLVIVLSLAMKVEAVFLARLNLRAKASEAVNAFNIDPLPFAFIDKAQGVRCRKKEYAAGA